MKLKKGSLVGHKIRDEIFRLGIALHEVVDNPYLKDSWKVAWISTDDYPVSFNGELYIDHVKKQNLIVISS